MDYNELAKELHKKYRGKITTSLRDKSKLDKNLLSAYYTPGVAEISREIADDESKLGLYHLQAIISTF